MEAPWVERMWRGALTVKKAREEKRKFKKFPPPSAEEAARLISQFIAERGVTKGPSPEERREMWGMG